MLDRRIGLACSVALLLVCRSSPAEPVNGWCFDGIGCWEFTRYGDFVDAAYTAQSDIEIGTAAEVSLRDRVHRFRVHSSARGPRHVGQFPFPTQSVVTWTYLLFAGVEQGQHDADYVYELPYESGASFRVTQAYGGRATHQREHHYALDFLMPVGTPVHAARSGTVVLLVDGDCDHSAGSGCPNVRIDIRHDDGTYASYQHLRPGSLLAASGASVEAGAAIAESGDSGNSGRPHLHFQVYTPTPDGEFVVESLPTVFRTEEGIRELNRGEHYTRAADIRERSMASAGPRLP